MPDGIEIKISGIKEVNKALYKYGNRIGDKVVLEALKTGAKYVQKGIKSEAPKLTGRLRRGIVVRKSKINSIRRTGNKIGVYITLRKGKGKKDPKDAFYGRFVNDGWRPKGSSKRVQGTHFIQKAWNQRRRNAVKLTEQALIIGSNIVKSRFRELR